MKKIIYSLSLVLVLAACTDYYTDVQLNHHSDIKDVRTLEYTLEASDYSNIASNEQNLALALLQDEDSVVFKALGQVGKDKAFNELATADMFVPAFVAAKYPQMDMGAQCNVTYRYWQGKESYLTPFTTATAYTLDAKDYKAIWGGRGAEYVTANSMEAMTEYLKTRFASFEEGKVVVLTYNYRTTEPDSLIDDLPYVCTVDQLLRYREVGVEHQVSGTVGTIKSSTYGRFYLVDGADSIYVYGLTDTEGQKVWKAQNIQQGDAITIQGKYAETEDGTPQMQNSIYVSHTPAVSAPRRMNSAADQQITAIYLLQDGEWVVYTNDVVQQVVAIPEALYAELGISSITDPELTINTYLGIHYPYALADDVYMVAYRGTDGMTADKFTYDGSRFVMDNGYVDETMTFLLKQSWEADISTHFAEPFIGHGQGDFVIQNIALDGLTYVWMYSALYGMKASAYASNTNHATESWLVSPLIKLKKAVHPALVFDQTQKYAGNFAEECTVWISTDYAGDVTTCTWAQIPWLVNEDGSLNVPDGGSWTFQSSGEMPLDEYVGQTVTIAFKYTSSSSSSATWEVKNLLVHEVAVE